MTATVSHSAHGQQPDQAHWQLARDPVSRGERAIRVAAPAAAVTASWAMLSAPAAIAIDQR